MAFIFPYMGDFIIPTDFYSMIFQRGRLLNYQPVTLSDKKNLAIPDDHMIPPTTRFITYAVGWAAQLDLFILGVPVR